MYTMREAPKAEEFVYLRRRDDDPCEYKPYALEVVQYGDLNQQDYYTMSVRGMTHYINGESADFTSE
jgi:dynein heavy chain